MARGGTVRVPNPNSFAAAVESIAGPLPAAVRAVTEPLPLE